jgi:hypothetical protein
MKQTAKEVAPAHGASVILAKNGRPSERVWRLQQQRPVGTVAVVMLDVDPKDLLQVATANDQQPVQALGADRPHPALRVRVRPGAPGTGVNSTSAPSERSTSSKLRENFASQSCSTKRARRPCSPSTRSRLRACWVTHWPFGLAVTPARWTRRVSRSMKNSTYSRRSQTVSTVKKSQATIPAASWRRNALQDLAARRGAGFSPWRRSVVRITVAERRTPSWSSSPWMRW